MTDRITFAASVAAKGRRLTGGVVLAGSRTWRNGEWLQVDPGAVVKANAESVIATWEHDDSKVLGATSNGTLRLSRTDQGIAYEIDNLPNTSYANDALELVRGGYVTGTSFEIEGLRSKFSTDPDGKRVRTITSIERLVAVNPVRDPAFVNSHVAAFGKEKDMTDIAEEPTKAPDIKPVEDDKGAAAFASAARGLDTQQLEAVLDSIMASAGGKLEGELLRRYEAFAKEHSERTYVAAEERERADRMKVLHEIRLGRVAKAPTGSEMFASDDYAEAFSKYLRSGDSRVMEQFAQSIAGDGTQGGFMVPDGFLQRIGERLKAFGGIASVSDEITTANGESLRWPYNDDTANSAAIAAEGVAGAAGADLVLSNITLGAWSYNANGTGNVPLKVSLELLQDAAFDVAAFVGRKLGERIGRKQAVDLATGAGTTLPFGLLSKTPDVMTATVASLAAPEHIFQVDSAYRDGGNCRFVMSDTNLAKLWTSQAAGLPIFIPGGSDIVGRPGGTLYGFPVTVDPGCGTLVAFGDIRAGYIIRRVRGVELLVDPYTASGTRQITYHAWARMDANIQDPAAYSVSEWSTVSADT